MIYHKLLVIGLDGAPYPIIQQWAKSGHLPNLAKLIERGSFGVLRSTIPVHSPTAWASFMTGLNPGKHGVFDFVKREPGSYKLRFVRSNQIAGASLWRLLSENGRKVGVINVPMTYPPEPVNGFLISGLGTPGYTTYTHPPELTEILNATGYRVNKEAVFAPGQEDVWLADIYDTTQRRGQHTLKLMQEQPWDFFMVVFRNTDEICHFFWHHMDETHPWHNPHSAYKNTIRDYYHYVDSWVGQIVEQAGEDTNIVIMSDHGAGPLYKDVFLNEWLWQKGWLKLKSDTIGRKLHTSWLPRLGITRKNISNTLTKLHLHRLEVLIKKVLGDRIQVLPRDERPELETAVDWRQTLAYSYGYYGQIFINLKGREPDGIVDPGQSYEELRQTIAAALLQITDPTDGQPVINKVFFKEELYQGDYLEEAPDLITIMRDFTYITRKGYEFAATRGQLFREPYTFESGSHRLEGILIAAGPDINPTTHLPEQKIHHLTPTLLHLLNCPIHTTMDGEVIEELLSPLFITQSPIRYAEHTLSPSTEQANNWNDKDEAEIIERLKSLGYLG